MSRGMCWVFANGELPAPRAVFARIQPGDRLIAADGGARRLADAGLRPDLLVGDFDSLTPQEVDSLAWSGTEVRRYPPEKDETDLELAMLAAADGGARAVRVIAALGGRLDQTLANLALLGLPELEGLDVRLDDGREEVFLIRGRAVIEGQAGERVSLLPWAGPASGVTTHGLRYPLRGETLLQERSRGVSNVMEGERAQVQVDAGVLVCVHRYGGE